MARNDTLKVLRTTRANLNIQAAASGLIAGEPYLITDENRIAMALTTSTYETYAKASEAPKFEPFGVYTPISGASGVAITDLTNVRLLRLTGVLSPLSDDVALWLRTDTNNGASFDAGASDYSWSQDYGTASSPTSAASAGDAKFRINPSGVGNATGEDISFEILLSNLNQARHTRIRASWELSNASTVGYAGVTGGRRINAAADNAVQLLFETGNISTGFVVAEAVRG